MQIDQIDQEISVEKVILRSSQLGDKQGNLSSKWCITLNNYSEIEYRSIDQQIIPLCKEYVVGKEIGESGTPHLQCVFLFKKRIRLSAIKKIVPRAHIETCKFYNESIIYCKKDGNFKSNIIEQEPLICIKYEELFKWQLEILDIINTVPDFRTINWYWENIGNVGKTMFTRYLAIHHNACVIQKGAFSDIMNYIYNCKEVKIFIIDVPRCTGNKISYNAIETIKSGIIFNSKYETGMKIINPPHIFVFSNEEPILENLSEDRWNIQKIEIEL